LQSPAGPTADGGHAVVLQLAAADAAEESEEVGAAATSSGVTARKTAVSMH